MLKQLRGDGMRLDKYLKVARILKRRTVSKELADNERVLVFGYRELTVRVLMLSKQVSKSDAALMFEIIEEKTENHDFSTQNE